MIDGLICGCSCCTFASQTSSANDLCTLREYACVDCGNLVGVCTSHLRRKRDLCTQSTHFRELAVVGPAGLEPATKAL
jgi:hypothetical protein